MPTKQKLDRLLTLVDGALERVESRDVLTIPENWNAFVSACSIRSGDSIKPFKPYLYQEKLDEICAKFSTIFVVKSRQLGLTQYFASSSLHKAAKSSAHTSVIFMPSQPDATALSERVSEMSQNSPWNLRFTTANIGVRQLRDGGKILFRNSGKLGGRGLDSVSSVILDEAAFWESGKIYGACSASTALVGDRAQRIVLSTPDIQGGFFYDRLVELINDPQSTCDRVASGELYSDGLPGWYWYSPDGVSCFVAVHWLCHPVYAEINTSYDGGYLKYRKDLDRTDWTTIRREYGLSFTSALSAAFSDELITRQSTGSELPPASGIEPYIDYIAGLDPASVGNDSC